MYKRLKVFTIGLLHWEPQHSAQEDTHAMLYFLHVQVLEPHGFFVVTWKNKDKNAQWYFQPCFRKYFWCLKDTVSYGC